ncbi:MAG: RNase adapter RapZ, partial [Actinomycetota bacterium]|nr:RNase adapter RapZ [Actinomycetota bacterium]
MELVVVTGMSGAGKSEALKYFEDSGYYAIDNLPTSMIANIADTPFRGSGKAEK